MRRPREPKPSPELIKAIRAHQAAQRRHTAAALAERKAKAAWDAAITERETAAIALDGAARDLLQKAGAITALIPR